MNFAFGPVFNVFSYENLKIYVSPCVTLRYETYETEIDYFFDIFVGIGCVPCINYYFSESFFVSGKFMVDFNIFYSGEDKETLRNSFFLQPSFGIGFKY